MQNLTSDEQRRLQDELSPGESALWAGRPNPGVIFHPSDWAVVPFSLLWGGFAIFWEAGVTGMLGFGDGKPTSLFFMLWGIPFVVAGQYFIWGRFFYAAWRKRRIFYAITNLRVVVIALPPRSKTIAAYIDTLPVIDREIRTDGIGTLKFGHISKPITSGRAGNNHDMSGLFLNSGVPVFVDVDEAASALSIVINLRERALEDAHRKGQLFS